MSSYLLLSSESFRSLDGRAYSSNRSIAYDVPLAQPFGGLAVNAMDEQHDNFIGIGIYGVPDAARLTQVPPRRIHRWVKGYTYKTEAGEWKRVSPKYVMVEIDA